MACVHRTSCHLLFVGLLTHAFGDQPHHLPSAFSVLSNDWLSPTSNRLHIYSGGTVRDLHPFPLFIRSCYTQEGHKKLNCKHRSVRHLPATACIVYFRYHCDYTKQHLSCQYPYSRNKLLKLCSPPTVISIVTFKIFWSHIHIIVPIKIL